MYVYYLASKVSAITADTYGVAALVPSNVEVHSLLSVVVAYIRLPCTCVYINY